MLALDMVYVIAFGSRDVRANKTNCIFKNSIKEPKRFLPLDDIWLQPTNQRSNVSNSLNP